MRYFYLAEQAFLRNAAIDIRLLVPDVSVEFENAMAGIAWRNPDRRVFSIREKPVEVRFRYVFMHDTNKMRANADWGESEGLACLSQSQTICPTHFHASRVCDSRNRLYTTIPVYGGSATQIRYI